MDWLIGWIVCETRENRWIARSEDKSDQAYHESS